MNDPTRPPLDRTVFDLIELAWHQVDKNHWPLLKNMQVAPQPDPPISLPVSKVPTLLLNTFQVYAGNLFKAEADQYDQFKTDRNYANWLVNLAERVQARVFRTIEIVERANQPRTMAYHGLTDDEILAGLSRFLLEAANRYIWESRDPIASPAFSPPPPPEGQEQMNPKDLLAAVSPVRVERPDIGNAPTPLAQTQSALPERQNLRDSYRATFPDVKIQDICWAAEQTYREWKRWIKGEAKDGSKPDRAFRRVLTSRLKPEEIRKQPRPTKYSV